MPDVSQSVSIQDVMAAVSRLQAAADALAAVGARAAVSEPAGIPAVVDGPLREVLAAAGVPDVGQLPPPQRAMVAAFVRSAFGQAANLLAEPERPPGWTATDSAVLEGQGRASMMVPALIADVADLGAVATFLDVGTGVGWLAVAAAELWPACTVVGIDTWPASLERARRNVAAAGVAPRVEIREQDVTDLDDRDRFDLAWIPSFYVAPDTLPIALERVFGAVRPGGRVVVGRYNPPPDALVGAALRLRTARDGGSWYDSDELGVLLVKAAWSDVHVLPQRVPSLTFVSGRKPAGDG